MQRLFARIEAAPVVTLAEIGGAALGGGMELALACDLRIAATDAQIGLPEARLGLIPGAGGTQRLTRLCGRGVAGRLMLGAEVIDGAEAARLGVVQWSEPRAQLPGKAQELAARYAALPRPALAAIKRCIAAQALGGTRGLHRGARRDTAPVRRPGGAAPGYGISRSKRPKESFQGDIMKFSDRIAVVTGSASGIGQATAEALAEERGDGVHRRHRRRQGRSRGRRHPRQGTQGRVPAARPHEPRFDREIRGGGAAALRQGRHPRQRRRLGQDHALRRLRRRVLGKGHQPELRRSDAPHQGAAAADVRAQVRPRSSTSRATPAASAASAKPCTPAPRRGSSASPRRSRAKARATTSR